MACAKGEYSGEGSERTKAPLSLKESIRPGCARSTGRRPSAGINYIGEGVRLMDERGFQRFWPVHARGGIQLCGLRKRYRGDNNKASTDQDRCRYDLRQAPRRSWSVLS